MGSKPDPTPTGHVPLVKLLNLCTSVFHLYKWIMTLPQKDFISMKIDICKTLRMMSSMVHILNKCYSLLSLLSINVSLLWTKFPCLSIILKEPRRIYSFQLHLFSIIIFIYFYSQH